MANKKKAPKKESEAPAPVKVVDPREPLPATDANFKATLVDLRRTLESLPKPEQPGPGDLVQAVLHMIMAEGLPCGYGQEAVRRLETSFVDRNEFRITEAFETAELLADLDIPDLFDRCVLVRDMVNGIYAEQNSVSLEFVRELTIADRAQLPRRIPAITPKLNKFLSNLLSFEEAVFSDKSTQRVVQRLGLDPADKGVLEFFSQVKNLLAPFGHLPFKVGPDGKLLKEPVLSPACLLLRLSPTGKR